ncbi:MAG: GNAT family N-acetyltransferase, partial [Gammaproteobacteria bacterium]
MRLCTGSLPGIQSPTTSPSCLRSWPRSINRNADDRSIQGRLSVSANGYDIRLAKHSDLPQIVEIYNHYVVNTHFTFDIDPFTVATRSGWWAQFNNKRCQCWVITDGTLGGYACSTPFKSKRAYETSVEVSV